MDGRRPPLAFSLNWWLVWRAWCFANIWCSSFKGICSRVFGELVALCSKLTGGKILATQSGIQMGCGNGDNSQGLRQVPGVVAPLQVSALPFRRRDSC